MKKHYNIHIIGRVQGVSFRYYTKEKADDLGILGFVRNELGSTVYIEAEGDEKQLEQFMEWCRHGPRFAQVAQVDVHEDTLKGYDSFEIV